jgi:hypothetical protein
MENFHGMSNGDLILCANLLEKDARSYEKICKGIADNRRELANRMRSEIDQRDRPKFPELFKE